MNIIAYYLPQFHRIKENDEWWGEGFTEWDNVKNAVSLFDGHHQPRVPLNENYYNLLDIDVMRWQSEIANKYGVSFCVYHYWFNGKLLLEKPMENLLKHKEIDFHFCFSWANENWTNAWEGKDSRILMQNDFNNQDDWKEHFDYLLPFFKDERYLKEKGNPIFVIYRPQMFDKLKEFINYWNELAMINGFEKIVFIYQSVSMIKEKKEYIDLFDYGTEFQPGYSEFIDSMKKYSSNKLRDDISEWMQKKFNVYISLTNIKFKFSSKCVKDLYSYEDMVDRMLNLKPLNSKMIPGGMVDWDNTPRYGKKGKVYQGSTPEKFSIFMSNQIYRAKKVYKKNAIFLFAWNEWGEGGYLEPDQLYGYRYLEEIKSVLEKNDEFEIPDRRKNSNIKIQL